MSAYTNSTDGHADHLRRVIEELATGWQDAAAPTYTATTGLSVTYLAQEVRRWRDSAYETIDELEERLEDFQGVSAELNDARSDLMSLQFTRDELEDELEKLRTAAKESIAS